MRVAITRTGVVLSEDGGALEKMLPPFKLGRGRPGGRRPAVRALDPHRRRGGRASYSRWTPRAPSGPLNLTAPEPVTNKELSKTLGRVLKRPAVAPVPALAIKALYGEMAIIVTTGVRAVPERLQELGYAFRQPELEQALRSATGR